LKRRKDELGRAVPERVIAEHVQHASGKKTKRGLVSLWLLGEREPYISQFFALCEKLDVNPPEILKPPLSGRPPVRRVTEVTERPRKIRVRKTRYSGNQ
jgi:hypothetical protein